MSRITYTHPDGTEFHATEGTPAARFLAVMTGSTPATPEPAPQADPEPIISTCDDCVTCDCQPEDLEADE